MAATNEEDDVYTIDEIVGCSSNAVHTNKLDVTTSDDCSVQVLIADDLVGDVTYGDIYNIVSENELSQGDVIEITEIGQIETEYSGNDVECLDSIDTGADSGAIQPRWKWYDITVDVKTSWISYAEYVAEDVFIASVARGEEYTLKKKFSESLSLTLETGSTYSDVTGKISSTGTITYEVEKSHKYTGPSETSKYNSVEFRVKFYARRCHVSQEVTGNISGHTTYYSAEYIVPTRYLSYSIYHEVA